MIDAEKVLRWMGYEEDLQSGWWMKHGETYIRADNQQDGWSSPIDANWIMGTLVPALEERLGVRGFKWNDSPYEGGGDQAVVLWDLWKPVARGTGPTFEAAFLAAAAEAIRSME